jgi:hypothetical protein
LYWALILVHATGCMINSKTDQPAKQHVRDHPSFNP